MSKKTITILNMVPLILSLVIMGSVLLWSPVCQDNLKLANGLETHMKCFYTGKASILTALILLIVSIENLIMKRKAPFAYIIIGIVLFILPATSPISIGICMKETMICQSTAIWLKVSSILIILSGIAALLVKGKYDLS